MEFHLENETGRYYFSMDKPCYSIYPDEKEVLLMQGIIAKVQKVHTNAEGATQIELEISEKRQRRSYCCRLAMFLAMFAIWAAATIYGVLGSW